MNHLFTSHIIKSNMAQKAVVVEIASGEKHEIPFPHEDSTVVISKVEVIKFAEEDKGKTVSLFADIQVEDLDQINQDDTEIPMKSESEVISAFELGAPIKMAIEGKEGTESEFQFDEPCDTLYPTNTPVLRVEGPATLRVSYLFVSFDEEEEEEEEAAE